jgi:hypothetical protein
MSSDAPLVTAARAGEVEAVRRLIAAGEPVNPPAGEPSALWVACASDAANADRIAVAALLLDAGASTRSEDAPPLHAAAERGPLALVELLIRRGAVEWIPDRAGRRPLDAARASMAPDRDAIVELLDRPVLRDPPFRAAVAAIQSGDVATLERLLDARPRLLHERAMEPACYRESGREQYSSGTARHWIGRSMNAAKRRASGSRSLEDAADTRPASTGRLFLPRPHQLASIGPASVPGPASQPTLAKYPPSAGSATQRSLGRRVRPPVSSSR